MCGAGVGVELDLRGWGRMLKCDGVKEGLLGLLKSFLLLLSHVKTALFFIRLVSGWSIPTALGRKDLKKLSRPRNLLISSLLLGGG